MKTLVCRLKKTFAFFAPANIARTNIRYSPVAGDTALLLIDVQKEFCDPKGRRGTAETREICERIQRLTPAFRNAGVPAYSVYMAFIPVLNRAGYYLYRPEKDDVQIRKSTDSAFASSKIDRILKADGRRHLLVCGFNLNACVYKTVVDACNAGYRVVILEDLTGNDRLNPHGDMIRKTLEKIYGVTFMPAEQALTDLPFARRKNTLSA